MPKYMYPLPGKPSFPVFGLGPQFDGFRWLIIWNDRQTLYTVTLGHGHPDSGSWIAVSTYLKTPKRQLSEDVATGPTGLNDAFFDAVTRLGEIGLADDERAKNALLESELAYPDLDETATLGPEWSAQESVVDEETRQSKTRRVGGAWATLIDLPTVAIAVTGPDSMAATAWPITNVSASLDHYV